MNFTLTVLGTASALPTTERHPSAQVLDVRGRLFLIDCSEGVQMQLRKAGVSFLRIGHIMISHIHGDHIFGIFGLLSTMSMLGRTADLSIYAPASFAPVLEFFLSNFGEGINFRIDYHPLKMDSPQVIYENNYLQVSAFPLNHRVETYGYLFREKTPQLNIVKEAIPLYGLSLEEIATLKRGEDVLRSGGSVRILSSEVTYQPYQPRSYAYCSDTAPFEELPLWVKGVSLLYHEATFPKDMAQMAAKTFHSTTVQAAECALEAGAEKLLVGHYSSRVPSVDFYLDEIKPIFQNAFLARDLMVVDIPYVPFQKK